MFYYLLSLLAFSAPRLYAPPPITVPSLHFQTCFPKSRLIFSLPSLFWHFIKIMSQTVAAGCAFSEVGIKKSVIHLCVCSQLKERSASRSLSLPFLPRATYIQQLFILLDFLTPTLRMSVCLDKCTHSINWGVGRWVFFPCTFLLCWCVF